MFYSFANVFNLLFNYLLFYFFYSFAQWLFSDMRLKFLSFAVSRISEKEIRKGLLIDQKSMQAKTRTIEQIDHLQSHRSLDKNPQGSAY